MSILDWYLVGLAAGLGVTAGAALVGVLAGRGTRALAASAAVAAVAVGFVSLRRLSADALPAALAGSAVLAVVPALGYLVVLAAPLLGQRLGRRAGSRYAGLRILAKD